MYGRCFKDCCVRKTSNTFVYFPIRLRFSLRHRYGIGEIKMKRSVKLWSSAHNHPLCCHLTLPNCSFRLVSVPVYTLGGVSVSNRKLHCLHARTAVSVSCRYRRCQPLSRQMATCFGCIRRCFNAGGFSNAGTQVSRLPAVVLDTQHMGKSR